MIVILKSRISEQSLDYQYTLQALQDLPNIDVQIRTTEGEQESVTEVYLLGDTNGISKENIEALPGVERVIRISSEYKILGRHNNKNHFEFTYNDITFSQANLHIFAGLCAVDTQESVALTFKALKERNLMCARMGAYKPRTSPYSFQGLGQDCLPYVFELAGKYGIKVIAMEVTHEKQIEEINQALENAGNATGVMLQIGTRNAQNFELLRAVGMQQRFPVLFKRGYGITLSESLHAAEYLAHAGNQNIVFCLRGVKSLFASPHRNLVDFAQVPVIKRLTSMPVCIDPSHSVGISGKAPDGISDIYHATAQGVISGANMVLVDFHPNPPRAIVDSKQAIPMRDLDWFLEDIAIARRAYEARQALAAKQA
ncbi:MAG: hypothetical protein AB7I18_14425 [Candidatus Berkiella sp.]